MSGSFARRPSPAPASPDTETVEIANVLVGQTVIVLANGHVLAGQIAPVAVKRRIGETDPQGRPVYDVDWQMSMANITVKSAIKYSS